MINAAIKVTGIGTAKPYSVQMSRNGSGWEARESFSTNTLLNSWRRIMATGNTQVARIEVERQIEDLVDFDEEVQLLPDDEAALDSDGEAALDSIPSFL